MSSGFWAFLLVWICMFQGGQCLVIGDMCGEETTIAGRTNCRAGRTILINTIMTTPALAGSEISDVCAQRTSFCFHDVLNDEYDCTFNTSNYFITCACPMEGIRWEDPATTNGTLVPGKTCNDLDECAMGNDDCDPHRANCTNVDGGFECVCKYGYLGDGKVCTPDPDVNPCLNGFDPICDINAECAPRAREVGCFDAAALSTSDLTIANGMTAFKCYELCTNMGTTYAAATIYDCYCVDTAPTGPDPAACIAQCGPSSNELCGNAAASRASYYYTGSDHSCTCKSGYTGNGTTCSDILECMSLTPPPHSSCIELVGSYKIVCDSGFIELANGSCVAANELDCNSIETIDTTEFRMKETWAPDCNRVVLQDCAGTGPTEELMTGTSSGRSVCAAGSLVTDFDHQSLFTFASFEGNTSWAYLNPVATCGVSKFSLLLDRVVLNTAGFSLDEMGFGDFPAGGDTSLYPSECRGRRYYDLTGPRYLFEHDFSDTCGVMRQVVDATTEILYFTLTGITGANPGVVSRQARLRFHMTCTYTKTRLINSRHFAIYNPRKKRETQSMPTLQVKSSETFLFAFDTSSPVKAGDMAYLEVDTGDGIALQWMQCWQSDSSDTKQGERRSIFEEGCDAADGTVLDNSVTIYRNKANQARFGFYPTAFSGGETENIYVHCIVNKCASSDPQSCTGTCKGGSFLPTSILVSSGAIVFSDPCGGERNGGCEQLCSVDADNEPLCGCVSGFEVDPQNPTLCKNTGGVNHPFQPFTTEGNSHTVFTEVPSSGPSARSGGGNFEWYYVVIPVVAILLIAAAILVARKTKEPSKSYKMPDLADLADDA